jgi:hypothetical protein
MSIYRREFIFEVSAGELERFGDGFDGHFTAPGPDDTLPWRAEGNLVEDLEHHYASPFKGRLPVAYRRIGDYIFAEVHCASFRS